MPWVGIAIFLFGPAASGDQGPPTFVYAIFGSIFVFFNVFALNMVLQYRRTGPWRDYLFGERMYVLAVADREVPPRLAGLRRNPPSQLIWRNGSCRRPSTDPCAAPPTPRDARPNRIRTPGRVCEADGCTTRLSIYNRVSRCSLHEERRTYIVRGRRRPRSPQINTAKGVVDTSDFTSTGSV